MNEDMELVLQSVERFGPLTQEELTELVPELQSYEVENVVDTLLTRGFITFVEEDKQNSSRNSVVSSDEIMINSDPFKQRDENQETLNNNLSDDISVDDTITLELTSDQAELFERMRTNVSRECGVMTREEFMDWVLREARRMTEV